MPNNNEKRIKLTKGKVAIVDASDYDALMKFKWCARKNRGANVFYAMAYLGKDEGRKSYYMHSLLLDRPKGMEIDHINGNGLDNRRSNLRICTRSENEMNRGKNKNNTSGYKGVCWNKNDKRWYVKIGLNNKQINLGRFSDKLEAYKAYVSACKKYHGKYAKY